jgi:hypothetical protein
MPEPHTFQPLLLLIQLNKYSMDCIDYTPRLNFLLLSISSIFIENERFIIKNGKFIIKLT